MSFDPEPETLSYYWGIAVPRQSFEKLPMIGELLGHRQAQTTVCYAHFAAERVRMAADAVTALINDVFAR